MNSNIKSQQTQQANCAQLERLAHDYLGIPASLDDASAGCRQGDTITLPTAITATDGVYSDTQAAFKEKGITISGTQYQRILDPAVLSVLKANMDASCFDDAGRMYYGKLSTLQNSILNSQAFDDISDAIKFNEFQFCTGITCLETNYTGGSNEDLNGGYGFSGWSNLTEITIPNTLTRIGTNAGLPYRSNGAFRGCIKLKKVNNSKVVTIWGDNAFFGCSSLETLDMRGATIIQAQQLFTKCTSLQKVYLPDVVPTLKSGTYFANAQLCVSSEEVKALYIADSTWSALASKFIVETIE